jgi:hypothetical protein
MMDTLSLRDRRQQISRHESGHVALAILLHIPVFGVEVEVDCGATHLDYGLVPSALAQAYAQDARGAVERVTHLLAILHAGPYCELVGGVHGRPPYGHDAEVVQTWRAAITQTLDAAWYGRILASSLDGLRGWYRYPRVQAAIDTLASGLANNPGLGLDALSALVAQSGLSTLPRPSFPPVMSSTVYLPGVSRGAAPRRPVTSAMALTKFARDDRGGIRPLRPDEWQYLQEHGVESIVPFLEPGELNQMNNYMEAWLDQQEAQRARQASPRQKVYCVRDDEDRVGYCDDHQEDDACEPTDSRAARACPVWQGRLR